MNGQRLSREFEQFLMIKRIKELDNIEDVKKVAVGLVELNFGMKQQVIEMGRMGWIPIYKPKTE